MKFYIARDEVSFFINLLEYNNITINSIIGNDKVAEVDVKENIINKRFYGNETFLNRFAYAINNYNTDIETHQYIINSHSYIRIEKRH